ncbi:hypothetical protein Indivirus_1_186 [Indivirus ILV1]|uniref:Uncharacterized protein n=1 Tax=Indivirus ILV1 TaxID=1977633 RepID=A0A1V0SCX1_9VIRU|nr:hypothetical protein Indivirus_1_186 [Indivirus ILV1]
MAYKIRLFFADSGTCKTIKDITRGVFAVAQIEQEFAPYVALNYLPFHPGAKGGIILVTDKYTIQKEYEFSEESVQSDIEDMRKIIWNILNNEVNIKNIADEHGCIINMKGYTTFKVTDHWKEKIEQLKQNRCCKFILDNVTSSMVRHNLLHDLYRLSHKDQQTREICKKVRGQECRDNFPSGSENYAVCISEVESLCNAGYPENKVVLSQEEMIQKIRTDLMEKLKKSNYKVDKKLFDELISAGLLTNLGERLRNKTVNLDTVRGALDDMFTENRDFGKMIEYRQIERFENNKYNHDYTWLFIILFIIITLVYVYYQNK